MKTFNVQMSSSACLKLCHICVRGIKGADSKMVWEGWCQRLEKLAVDLQHGTGVEESSHLYTIGHHPKSGFLHLKAHTFHCGILHNIVLILYIFLLCRLK